MPVPPGDQRQAPTEYNPYGDTSHAATTPGAGPPEVAHHWFYRASSSGGKEQWKPFSMIDSVAIEEIFLVAPNGKCSASIVLFHYEDANSFSRGTDPRGRRPI